MTARLREVVKPSAHGSPRPDGAATHGRTRRAEAMEPLARLDEAVCPRYECERVGRCAEAGHSLFGAVRNGTEREP